jgi:hypothetical protein
MGLTNCTRLWLQVTVTCDSVVVSAFERCNILYRYMPSSCKDDRHAAAVCFSAILTDSM